MAKKSARDEDAPEDADDKPEADAEGGEEGGAPAAPEKARAPFSLSAGVVQILKYVLMGFLVIILSIGTNFVFNRLSGGKGGGMQSKDDLLVHDPNSGEALTPIPKGADWNMDPITINTADDDEQHIVRFHVIISYDKASKTILGELNDRRSQIHHDVRNIVGSKKYLEMNTTDKQQKILGLIKSRVVQIVNQEGIQEVFLKEFTVH